MVNDIPINTQCVNNIIALTYITKIFCIVHSFILSTDMGSSKTESTNANLPAFQKLSRIVRNNRVIP